MQDLENYFRAKFILAIMLMPSNNEYVYEFAPLVGQSWLYRVVILHA